MTSRMVGTTSASRPGHLAAFEFFIEDDKRHIADGVGGVRHIVFEIPHPFKIAVVGQDHGAAAQLLDLVEDLADAGIDGLGGLTAASSTPVWPTIRGWRIADDDIILAAVEPFENHIADLMGAHLRLES